MATYAFIDAAYVLADFRGFATAVLGNPDARPDMSVIKTTCSAERAFVYYAVKEKPADAADEAKQAEIRKWLDGVTRIPGVHVRLGVVKSKTGRKEQVQKEVDVMLAVDAMTHAFRRNMDRAALVAGDLDFHPLVQALVDAGCYVGLVAARRSVSSLLIDAADDWIELDARMMVHIGGRGQIYEDGGSLAGLAVIHTGVDSSGTKRAEITRLGGSPQWVAAFPPKAGIWRHEDLDLLKKAVAFELQETLTWKP